jgi:hypothetical protein
MPERESLAKVRWDALKDMIANAVAYALPKRVLHQAILRAWALASTTPELSGRSLPSLTAYEVDKAIWR